jgi:cyclohexanecarboxyl-CoA dehydrogenase
VDLAFTPEQEELVRTLRAFAAKELRPRSAQWDKTGEFPWDTYRQMAALGLLGLRTPAAHGGQEADLLTFGLAMEAIARGDFGSTYGMQLAGLAGEILGRNASDEIKTRWLPAAARGDAIVALALTEPGVGSDAANLVCRAERDGDEYVITGEKSGISLGMVAHAAIVFARTDPRGRARGVTAFLVPLDWPGVARSPLRDMGTRAVARAVLAFDHVRVPASHRLGAEGTGFHQVMRGFDYNRVGIALACLGAAQVSLEETMAYVKERSAFGRRLATFEGVSFPLVEAATHVDACRWLCYRALWLADRGQPYTKE